ncbi:MAG: NFACT family protein, partial [Clostridia bacterium]
MPMDGFTLSFLSKELHDTLLGGRVDKINQPERDALLILVRSGGNHKLLLSANAGQARVQLTAQSYENPSEPPMFCMLMRKHLLGARIVDLYQVNGDRILAIVFDCIGDLSDHVQKTLYLELMGRYSNLILTNEQGIVLDSIRHVNSEMSRV